MRKAAVIVFCAVLVACGSSSNRLSKREYAARANSICARFNAKVRAFGTATNIQQLGIVAGKTAPALQSALRDLRRLRPPKNEASTAKEWLTSIDRLHTDVIRIRDRARANDLKGVRGSVPAATKDDSATARLARKLGASSCAENS